MDAFEISRRNFLHKLGLSVGAVALSNNAISGTINQNESQFGMSAEQIDFMTEYDEWMDRFIDVIKVQRQSPDDLENNKKLVALTEISDKWKDQLAGYMKEPNFAQYYMIVTERMTKEIE